MACEAGDSIFFEFFGWGCRIDHTIYNFERYSIQKLAASARWPSDTFAAVRLIVRVMGLAHQILALFGKELVVDPIHRHRYVPTAIYIGVKLAFIIDNEAFLVGALDLE